MQRGFIVDGATEEHINEVSGCQKLPVPEFERHMCITKKG
jgi:hypothetical protein